MGGGESQQEKSNQQNSSQQQEAASKTFGTSQGTLGTYMGPLTSSPIYKSLLQSGTQSTNAAYDASTRNLKQAMEAAGVQGSSAAAAGNTAAQGAARATALGQVQPAAIQGAAADQLSAVGLNNQIGSAQQQAATQYSGQATQEDIERMQEQSGLMGAMMQAGVGLVGANPWGVFGA